MTRCALDKVHCASMRMASFFPITIVEATSNPFSSLKQTLVDKSFCPFAFNLISMELFSNIDFCRVQTRHFKCHSKVLHYFPRFELPK
jgi:hypothetical protein